MLLELYRVNASALSRANARYALQNQVDFVRRRLCCPRCVRMTSWKILSCEVYHTRYLSEMWTDGHDYGSV